MHIKEIFDTPCLITESQRLALAHCAAQVPQGGVIAEIGPFRGGSTRILAGCTKALVHTIDIFDNIDRNLLKDRECRIHIGDSSSFATANPDCSIDLLFIDGDHSFHGVLHDFTHTQRLLSAGATIIFHDYTQAYPGVMMFCDALQDSGAIVDCAVVDGMLVCRKGSDFNGLVRSHYEHAVRRFEADLREHGQRAHVVNATHNYRRIAAELGTTWEIIGKGSYGQYFSRFFSLPPERHLDSSQAASGHKYVICSRNFDEIAEHLAQRCGIRSEELARGDDVLAYGMFSDLLTHSGQALARMSIYEDEVILGELLSSLPEPLLCYMFVTGLLVNTFKRTANL